MSQEQDRAGRKFDLGASSGSDAESLVVAAGPREGEALLRWRESRNARASMSSELVLRRWPGDASGRNSQSNEAENPR